MNKLKLLFLVCLFSTASFAQATDTITANNKTQTVVSDQKSEMATTISSNQKYLNKQVNIRKEKTTWTKIKDLFM